MTAFSQHDPRWARNALGTSTTLTIGQAGCLITCAASMLTDWGIDTDPGRLNRWLRAHGGYTQDCLFRFAALAGLGADLIKLITCRSTPAPVSELAACLDAGRAVLAEVNAHPGRPHSPHWVRLLPPLPRVSTGEGPGVGAQEYLGAGAFTILDPWRDPGDELATLPPAYALPSWNAGRVITAAAVYAHNTDRVIPLSLTAADSPAQITPAIYAPPERTTPMGPKPLEE